MRVELNEIVIQKNEKILPTKDSKLKFVGMDCLAPHTTVPKFYHNFKDFKSAGNGFKPNHVLYGRLRPYLNKVMKPSFEGVASGEFIVLEPKPGIEPDFILYQLHSRNFVRYVNNQVSGDRPRVKFDQIKKYQIILPPLPEQRAIVSKIEQLFRSLDNGIANLKAAQAKLVIYRQAVLKKAFEGEWRSRSLKKLASITGGVTKGRKLEGRETFEFPYLRVANVQDGYLDLTTIKNIKVLMSDFEKYKLEYEDVLFTEGGDRDKLGRGTVWHSEVEDCIHQNHIFRARINDREELSPYFLSYYAQSPCGKEYFFKHGKQTVNLASINKTILSGLPIPLPTIKEQHQIVQEIETRLSVCDSVSATIEDSLKKAEALRQSILKKAFEGELLDEAELEACRREADWEPAEVLLKRIRGKGVKG